MDMYQQSLYDMKKKYKKDKKDKKRRLLRSLRIKIDRGRSSTNSQPYFLIEMGGCLHHDLNVMRVLNISGL